MKMIKNISLIVGVFIMLGAGLAQAQEINYSGTWVLDKDKSSVQGRMWERIDALTIVITQEGEKLKIENIMQFQDRERSTTVELTIGGEAVETEGMRRGRGSGKAITKAEWSEDKKNLIVKTESEFEARDRKITMKMTDTYGLSEDGKTLNIQRETESPRGTRTDELVFSAK